MTEEEYEKLKIQVEEEKEKVRSLGTEIKSLNYSVGVAFDRSEYEEGVKECKKIIKSFNKLSENKEKYQKNIDELYEEKQIRELSIKKHLNKKYDSNQVFDLNSDIFEKYVDDHFGYSTSFGIDHEDEYTNMCEIYMITKDRIMISMKWDNNKTVRHNFKRFFDNCEKIEEANSKSEFKITRVEIKDEDA